MYRALLQIHCFQTCRRTSRNKQGPERERESPWQQGSLWGLQCKYQPATFRQPCFELAAAQRAPIEINEKATISRYDNDLDDALVSGGWTPGGGGSSRGSEVKWRG
jgi:hypothetical protein